MSDLELETAVADAIRGTLAALHREHPAERLAGYAILVDDDASVLHYAAVTHEGLARVVADSGADDPLDVLFSPVDWPYDYDYQLFTNLSGKLAVRRSDARGHRAHVEHTFELLVRVLLEARARGTFDENVFLSAASPDPGVRMKELEEDAVGRLNLESRVQERRRWWAKWK